MFQETISPISEIEVIGSQTGGARQGAPHQPAGSQSEPRTAGGCRSDRTRLTDWKKPFQFFPSNPVWNKEKEWVLEIGPGKGEFLLGMAAQHPQTLFIAVEIRNGRFKKISKKVEEKNLKNVILVHGDAGYCLPYLFGPESLKEIYILFPDPWPKRRHQKHRLLNTEKIEGFYQMLESGGCVWIATDHQNYSEQIQAVFSPHPWNFQKTNSLYPTSFETKWKKMGKKIEYFCFVKRTY